MSIWQKLINNLPRPSLLWMSYNDVLRVRNQLAALCYPRGNFITIQLSKQKFGDLFPGLVPRFVFPSGGIPTTAWLKVCPGRAPQWDILAGHPDLPGEVNTVEFNNPEMAPLAALVKKWSVEFNYKPHEASLIHKGEFLA